MAPIADELAPEAHAAPQVFYEQGAHAGQAAANSSKVGFTLRDSRDRIVDAFAFLINPQGLQRTLGSRATLTAVKAGFFVDDFGAAPTAIQMRQLIAMGKVVDADTFYTAREDVQRFLTRIYLPATEGLNGKRYRVFFHDHHFERGMEERVFFPPNSLEIARDVSQHNVWRLDLQMIGLEKHPYSEVEAEATNEPAARNRGVVYYVQPGDTIEKLIRRLAGANPSTAKLERIRAKLLDLNPQLKKNRKVSTRGPFGLTVEKQVKAGRLSAGELIRLPA